jgi:hypothetical protein
MEKTFALITIFLAFAFSGKCSDVFSRCDFPEGFVFGSSTSAYQELLRKTEGNLVSGTDFVTHIITKVTEI